MNKNIGKAVYTIELAGAGKALQDLYSLDRAMQKVGKSAKGMYGGGGGGGSRPPGGSASQGGGIVSRVLASRLPGQGLIDVPSLINEKQTKAIEKALADTSRTFSQKQREMLERALIMLKSSKDVTGATIEFANAYVRGFDEVRNKTREKIAQLRAAYGAMAAVDPGFATSGAGRKMAFDIRSTELLSGAGRTGEINAGASGYAKGVSENIRAASIVKLSAELNNAVELHGDIEKAMARYQFAVSNAAIVERTLNDIVSKRLSLHEREAIIVKQIVDAENARRKSEGMRPMTKKQAKEFASDIEVQRAMSMAPMIAQQEQYALQLEKTKKALERIQQEEAKVAASGNDPAQLAKLQATQAFLAKRVADLKQLQEAYDELNQSVVRLENAQRNLAANPSDPQLKKDFEKAAAEAEQATAKVNQLKFAAENSDNSFRHLAKSGKNAGFAMIQASYGVQDFIQVLAGGGGLQYALLASANNFSQVIVASEKLSASLGAVGAPLVALGATAGMLAVSAWLGKTKSEAERLADAVDGLNRSFDHMTRFAESIASTNMLSGKGQASVSGAFGIAQERATRMAGERVSSQRNRAVMAEIEAQAQITNSKWTRIAQDELMTMLESATTGLAKSEAPGWSDRAQKRTEEMARIRQFVVSEAEGGNVTNLMQLSENLKKGVGIGGAESTLTSQQQKKLSEAIDEMIKSINESKIASNEFAEKMFQATKNMPTEGMTDAIASFDQIKESADKTFKVLQDAIDAEMKLANPDSAKLAKLRNAQAMIPEIAEFEMLRSLKTERGTPSGRMDLETLEEYGKRASDEIADRIKELESRRDAELDPEVRAELDAAIGRNKRQQANVVQMTAQQRGNMQARASLAASGDELGMTLQGITENTQAAIEAANRDLEGPELQTTLANIAASDARQRRDAIRGERGTPVQRMDMETLAQYGARANQELAERITNLQAQRAAETDPGRQAELDAAIARNQQQQANLAQQIPMQQGNILARAALAASGDELGSTLQGINESTQSAVEAAKRDLEGPQLQTALADIATANERQRLDAIRGERGSATQRMDMETLAEYGLRANQDYAERIAQLQAQRAASTNPREQAELDAAIARNQQQQANLAQQIPQQQANMQARAFFAASGDILGAQLQSITENTQAAIEAAKRDLSGAQLQTVLADIASSDARQRGVAQREFAGRQADIRAGFEGAVLQQMGGTAARMGAEDLNLMGQFRDIQSMLDSGALGTGPAAVQMAQDMLDMATAVSEQRKKDIEFENKKAGFSDIGSLWKQIQMSLKPDKSTQLQQQSVNILTAIQNRLAQGLSLTIP